MGYFEIGKIGLFFIPPTGHTVGDPLAYDKTTDYNGENYVNLQRTKSFAGRIFAFFDDCWYGKKGKRSSLIKD